MNRMNIALAPHRTSLHWEQTTITWDELLGWVLDPGDRKESGNYILGTLRETKRTHNDHECHGLHRVKEAIVTRDALTLDSDSPSPDFVSRVRALGVRALIHTTFSSTPAAPRYRVIIPLSRPVTPAEYAAEATDVIETVGAASFDPGSTQAERYMFRPAGDDSFDFEVIDGPLREPSAVPSDELVARTTPSTKRDPFDLPGIVGAFNRTYDDLDLLIAKYDLPYDADGDRWVLRGADAAPGVSEISPGLWWSSHSTDPAHGHAQTAFDLVRVHRFGELDSRVKEGTMVTERPSYASAIALAEADETVRLEQIAADFGPASPVGQLGYDPDSTLDWDLASNLADRDLRDLFRYTDERGWHEWDGQRWKLTTSTSVVAPLVEAIRDLATEWTARGVQGSEVKKLLGALDQTRTKRLVETLRPILRVKADVFDAHPDLLNVGNGTVDLRTGQLREHRREDYLTKVSPVNYVPGARHEDWDTTLGVLRDDVMPWMKVRMGQAVTGHRTPDDLMPILQGGGANGKTTFTGAIFSALGEHAVFLSERVLLSNPGDHPTEMMDLQGARFALLEETPEGHRLNVKRLKSLVGTPTVTARKMRQDSETFNATHSIFLTTNYDLAVSETDTGTWRRLKVIRFPFTFSSTLSGDGVKAPDPGLRTRMEESPSGQHEAVLSWLVEGALQWYSSGFPETPESIVADTNEWRLESDPVLSFVRDCLEFDPASAITTTDLHHEFNNYLADNGNRTWTERTIAARFAGHSEITSNGVRKALSEGFSISRVDPLEPVPSGLVKVWAGVRFKNI